MLVCQTEHKRLAEEYRKHEHDYTDRLRKDKKFRYEADEDAKPEVQYKSLLDRMVTVKNRFKKALMERNRAVWDYAYRHAENMWKVEAAKFNQRPGKPREIVHALPEFLKGLVYTWDETGPKQLWVQKNKDLLPWGLVEHDDDPLRMHEYRYASFDCLSSKPFWLIEDKMKYRNDQIKRLVETVDYTAADCIWKSN